MANFVKGFSQGFDVGNKVIDTINNRERQKKLDARNETLEQREDTQWEQGQEKYNHGLERRGIEEKQADEAHDLGIKRTEKAMSLADKAEERAVKRENRTDKTFNYDQKIKTRKQDAAIIQDQMVRAQATGDYSWFDSDQATAAYGRNPHLEPKWITSDPVRQAAGSMLNILNGAANGQMPQWNDPDMLNNLDTLMPEIVNSTDLPQTTKDGKKIVGRKITGVIPMEGGKVAIQMDITDEDGKTYSAPVTKQRTHNDDDNVAVIGIDVITNRINLINQAHQDDMIQKTAKYMNSSSGKSGKSNKPTLKKELFDAESQIRSDYRKQIADLDARTDLKPEQKKAQKIQIEKSRNQELAQVRLSAGNILGEGIVNLEGQQRENKINGTMDLLKQAHPDIEFTPEIQGEIRKAINEGESEKWISDYIADEANNQEKTNPTQPIGDQSSSIFSDFFGTPKTTSTGGQTTTGGRFYKAGNDIGKPNVVNEDQANMTPYQQRQGNGLASYQPYQ